MRIFDEQLILAGDLSQASLTSNVAWLDSMYGAAIQCIFSGNATGTLAVQASNDPGNQLAPLTITNWSQISTSALAAPGTVMFNLDAMYYRWLRVVYTKTAGAGALTINLHAKGV